MKTKSQSHTISEARRDLIRTPALFIALILGILSRHLLIVEQKDASLNCEIFYGEDTSLRTFLHSNGP